MSLYSPEEEDSEGRGFGLTLFLAVAVVAALAAGNYWWPEIHAFLLSIHR